MPSRQKNNVRRVKKKHLGKNRRHINRRYSVLHRGCSMCSNYTQDSMHSRIYVRHCQIAPERSRSYRRIKWGLKKSNPAAIVLWVFHKVPSSNGLTAKTVIRYLKTRYVLANNPRKVGKCIGSMLRSAVEFGLLQKLGDKYFLKKKVKPRSTV